MSGAGIKLQTFRDALNQNNANRGKEKKGKVMFFREQSAQLTAPYLYMDICPFISVQMVIYLQGSEQGLD